MARGKSGRIVLEVDPELKERLYSTLAYQKKTMKEWFVKEAEQVIYDQNQPSLFENKTTSAGKNPDKD